MNGDAALNLLMARLKGRSNATLRANALVEMNLAMSEYYTRLGFTPWFLRLDYTDAAFLTVVDQEYVSVPSGYIGMDAEWGALYYNDPDDTTDDPWVEVDQGSYNIFKRAYKDEVTGKPEVFDVVDDKIYLRPIPDAAYDLRLWHYNSDEAAVDAASTNIWLTNASSWIIGEAGFYVASLHIGDTEAAKFFDAMRSSAKSELTRTHVAREANAGEFYMGERP